MTTVNRTISRVMLAVAASLAVASALHLSGHVSGRAASFDPDAAGIAEAIIGAVLLAAAVAMTRLPAKARAIGVSATAFALAGFLVGISETARGGHIPDIAYHATIIPVLLGSLIGLVRTGQPARV